MPDDELQTETTSPTPDEELDYIAKQLETMPVPEENIRKYTSLYISKTGGLERLGMNSNQQEECVQEIVDSLGENGAVYKVTIREHLGDLIRGRTGHLPDSLKPNIHKQADPVMMFNGQYIHQSVDMRIDGAGINFSFRRNYKNQVTYNGPLGANWNHEYNLWLREAGMQLILINGELTEEVYQRHSRFGETEFSYYIPPDGQQSVILPLGDSYEHRSPDGTRYIFEREQNMDNFHRLGRIEDRHENFLQFIYIDSTLDHILVNHQDRRVDFQYDELNRIISLVDFTGRIWRYTYDDHNDLISVTTPATDQYPMGLTTCYEYSSGSFSGQLEHNLTRIIDPAHQLYLENEYGITVGQMNFNRVIRQRQGSGESCFDYQVIISDFEHDYNEDERPVFQTNFIDRNSHAIHYVYNTFGNLLMKEEEIIKEGKPFLLKQRFRYNRDGNLVASLSSEGILNQYYYGRAQYLRKHGIIDEEVAAHNLLTMKERQAFGNLLAVVQRGRRFTLSGMNISTGIWGDIFPDMLKALDKEDVVKKFTYEPIYCQLATESDPRFTIGADPNHVESSNYHDTMTKYEYYGPLNDSNRYLKCIIKPTPTWPNGTKAGPVIEEMSSYDIRGRLLRSVNSVGMITEYTYFNSAEGVLEGHLKRKVLDPGGLAITITFDVDDLGRCIAIHNPRSKNAPVGYFVTQNLYNALDQNIQTTQSLPFGFVTRRVFDPNGNLIREEKDAKNETGNNIQGGPVLKTYKYDEQLNLIQETISGVELENHLITRNFYNGSDKRVLTIFPGGNRMRIDYDARLLEVAITMGVNSPDSATTRTEYDGDGMKVRTYSARGYVTNYKYDTFGRNVEQIDALAHVVKRKYDKAGNLLVERVFEYQSDGTYRLISRKQFEYDELNRLVREGKNLFETFPSTSNLDNDYLDSPGPGRLIYKKTYYDASGKIIRSVDELGRASSFQYDAIGRLIREEDPRGNVVESKYDPNGNLIRQDVFELVQDSAIGGVQSFRCFASEQEYDELDRLITVTNSMGNTIRHQYDSLNNLVLKMDPLGNVIRYSYDFFGRRTGEICEMTETGLGGDTPINSVITSFNYDPNNNLISIIDPLGRETRQLFDALNRRRALIFTDGSQNTTDYDKDGNIVKTTDCNGLVRNYTVDALGRTTYIKVDNSQLLPGLTVKGANYEKYTYDALGRTVMEENDYVQSEISLNSLGWATSETFKFNTLDAPFLTSLKMDREYYDSGALKLLTYPDGRTVRYDRNETDQLTRIKNITVGNDYPGRASTPNTYQILSIDYIGKQRSRKRLANSAEIIYHYDGAKRLIEIKNRSASGKNFLTIQQMYDAAANLRFRNDVTVTGGRGERFLYDSLYRVTRHETVSYIPLFTSNSFAPAKSRIKSPIPNRQDSINKITGPLKQLSNNLTWAYDANGNRVTEQPETSDPTVNYIVNELDQYTMISGISHTYDANGNMIDDGTQQYHYDSMDRLVTVIDKDSGTTLCRFFHDVRGRRILELADGHSKHLLYDGLDLILEYRDGTIFAQYVHDDIIDSPVQIAAEGTEHYYHADHSGSVRVLTNKSGDPVATYCYTPFGLSLNSAASPYNPVRFAGRRLDKTIGTYDFRTRQYHPTLGRFLQRDKAGMVDHTNLYSYTNNNPLTFVDPLGTERQDVSSGESPSPEFLEQIKSSWEQASTSEKTVMAATGMGVAAQVIPYFGDYIAIGASAVTFAAEPSWENFGGLGLDIVGAVLPFVPSIGTLSKAEKLLDEAENLKRLEKVIEEAENLKRLEKLAEVPKPDVPVSALKRWTIIAGENSRGYTDTLRKEIQEYGRTKGTMYGPPTEELIHVGHDFGRSHVFTLPGQPTKVGAQTAASNLRDAHLEKKAAEARRIWNEANPNGPQLPVRPRGSK
ncbi:hypothetical protein CON74_23560 [Bacillus thuringiensis]|uniref:RHS repeat-associated core domain-containing protein n=1 Tax=Bacillus thuringiensis TaxID=1428 RepID=UPI000BEBAD91|nr:RHS repeat-associated core domain-containing protein [Bacillus thuringiensis]PEA58358.1 hypothetical protein CON74_23560 [Bacillus thuringiensis]